MRERIEKIKSEEWEPTGQNIFITGGTGLVGTGIIKFAQGKDNFINYSRGETEGSFDAKNVVTVNGDILDEDFLCEVVGVKKPDVVIHTVAVTNVDKCQESLKDAIFLNTTATENIVKICNKFDIPLIFVSTDFVFPRVGGPFGVKDRTSTLTDESGKIFNLYGDTKRWGEIFVLENMKRNGMILRISSPYDENYKIKKATPILLMDLIKEDKDIKAVFDATTTYTHVSDIALGINKIIKERLWEKESVLHIAGPEQLSAYDLALIFKSKFFESKSEIVPVKLEEYFRDRAPRPVQGGLIDSIIEGKTIEEALFKSS